MMLICSLHFESWHIAVFSNYFYLNKGLLFAVKATMFPIFSMHFLQQLGNLDFSQRMTAYEV